MNNEEYINYFNFLKNLKNGPDTGMPPLQEWQKVMEFFTKVLAYLDCEWGVNVDRILDYSGCKFDEYSDIFRHRQMIANIVVSEFRERGSVNNASSTILDYLQANRLYNPPPIE